jgi:LAO/AO transport system kinase
LQGAGPDESGIPGSWEQIEHYRDAMIGTGEFQAKRQRQAVDWMWTLIDSGLRRRFRHHPKVRKHLGQVSRAVAAGERAPLAAAYELLGYLE